MAAGWLISRPNPDLPEIYVRPFPGGEGKWKISISPAGLYPVWSRARHELFYLEPISGQTAS